MRIDEIYNNTADTILLSPNQDVEVTKDTKFTGTGAVKLPVGDDSQRPTAAQGMLRYNTDQESFEGYNGTEWGAIGGAGGGGSAGINFVIDPSFESEDLAPTDNLGGGTATYPLYTSNDKLYSEFNTKFYQLAHTGLSAASYDVSYSQARTGLDGKQGLFSIWINVDAEGLELCVQLDSSGTCESTVSIIGDSTWRKYEIPFVFGASSVEFEIANPSLTGNVTLQLDKVYIGTMPDGYIQDVGQAHFVGSLQWDTTTNCAWTNNSSTFNAFTNDADCDDNPRTVEGSVYDVQNGLKPHVGISNARTDGTYRITYQGNIYTVANAAVNNCRYKLVGDNDSNSEQVSITSGILQVPLLQWDIKFTSSGNKDLQIHALSSNNTDNCVLDARTSNLKISVHFFPDDNSTIVSQNTELTAQTANEFGARIDNTDAIVSENFDWINGDCTDATLGRGTCNFNTGIFQDTPNCTCTSQLSTTSDLSCQIVSVSSSQVVYQNNANGSGFNTATSLKCSKTTDYNKSATIIGKFENINSSELLEASYTTNDAIQNSFPNLTDNDPIIFEDKVRDNYNAYNTSTGELTIPTGKNGNYLIKYCIGFGSALTDDSGRLRLYIDVNSNNIVKEISFNNINVRESYCIDKILYLNEGDIVKAELYQSNGATIAIDTGVTNNFDVIQLPDTESIIKNLSQEKTKCQTKYLSANFSPTTISDNSSTNFTNLTLGKKYRACVQLRGAGTYSGLDVMGAFFINSSDVLGRVNFTKTLSNELFSVRGCTHIFTATNSSLSLSYDIVESGNSYTGGTTANTTYVELCELPSTYVETTEW